MERNHTMQLAGETAIVTGGAVRLGRTLALALAYEGVKVVLHYHHSKEAALATAGEIRDRGGSVELVQADFSDSESAARQVVERAVSAFGPASILINSAAIFERAALQETTGEIWDRHHAINLKTPFFLAKEFSKQLPNDARGQILNILDWRATHPAAGTSHLAYTIAKSGLAALTEALAVELGPQLQVNGIAPGAILPAAGDTKAEFRRLAEKNALNRVGSPADVVGAALYLLKSDFVTGEILHVNGGEHFPA